jgi:hypothetical protein
MNAARPLRAIAIAGALAAARCVGRRGEGTENGQIVCGESPHGAGSVADRMSSTTSASGARILAERLASAPADQASSGGSGVKGPISGFAYGPGKGSAPSPPPGRASTLTMTE